MAWTKKNKPTVRGPAVLTDDERYDAAQSYFYNWLSRAELAGLPKTAPREPQPGEI